ncbi:LpxI family protein [Rubellimicrobium aerolatum]|uniref:LpxI family protein n=1 Tax=Rubellimicrobium aerolatum TaxID=490979 RepID=A0ABW0S8E4_9RHOB|nr:UDP-2,3-diacylglucosamine diphosphatase LpxI [Rubellimicrobium aerolatum]MBP1804257.1 DUF1009 family protein [Rubellimicrobium aerolatum]
MIALIGSPGALTGHLAATLGREGRPHLACVLSDRTDLAPPPGEPLPFRVEHLGRLLVALRERGVTGVCFSGGIRRPSVDPSQIDALTMPFVPRFLAAARAGDDGALRVILSLFEEAGFAIHAAHEIAPDLLPPAGVLTAARPTPAHEADAARAEQVHRILAPADIGQGVVVRRGQVLAVEALPGTDFMLDSLRDLARDALFYKAPKATQDRRADLPAIGPATMERARAAGLSAIVIESNGVMVLDRAATVAAANAAGLVLWVREPGP